MIKIEHITKYFKVDNKVFTALDDVSLFINKGEIFGIVGKSGAGKSTLLRCVNLLESPDSGNIIINDNNLVELSPSELRKESKKLGLYFSILIYLII